jgi:hypothetical protein
MELGGALWRGNGILRWFYYTLATGASWQGPIERSTVTVDFSRVRSYEVQDAWPLAGMRPPGKRLIAWEWRQFKPGPHDSFGVAFIPERYAVMVHGGGATFAELRRRQVRLYRGQLMVPVRAIAECAGGSAIWDGRTRSAVFGPDKDHRVEARVGQREISVGGKTHRLAIAPYLARSRFPYLSDFGQEGPSTTTLFVPLRSLVEAMGGQVRTLYQGGPWHAYIPDYWGKAADAE